MFPTSTSPHHYTLVPLAPHMTPQTTLKWPVVPWEYLLVTKQFPEGTCRWTYTFRGLVVQGVSGPFVLLWGQLGADGWELVAVVAEETASFYFKRRYHAARPFLPPAAGVAGADHEPDAPSLAPP
jgi:hypothetical protein